MPDLKIPQPPIFATVEAERDYHKQHLAAAFRLFARYGFDEGVAGHLTARDPEFPDCFWVNPFGMYFGHIRVSDLVLVNHKGEVIEGDRAINAAAFAIHAQIHQARPDVVAAAHVHSVYGKARSCQAQLMAEQAGNPIAIASDIARLTYSQIGGHYIGWFSFQSLYEKIIREEPDLLQ
ncbi:MAG: class II aldolase/adducin family protein [Cyanobacteria bacterium P01_E01_bin.42]